MTALLLIAILSLAPRAAPSVEGVVTHSATNEPLARVEIRLLWEGKDPETLPEAVTDSRGRFTIPVVLPGTYVLQAQRGGYTKALRTIVVSADSETLSVALTLRPGGVITGRALGADGRPAAGVAASNGGVQVSVARILLDGSLTPPLQQPTDDRGDYRIYGLEAGEYYVWAEHRWNYYMPDNSPQDSWRLTYFPGVADREKATRLEVAEGTVLSGIDFTLQPQATFSLSGELATETSINRIPNVFLVRRNAPAEPGKPETVGRVVFGFGSGFMRNFQVHGVPPGSYTLFSTDRLDDVWGRMDIDISHDVHGIRLAPQPGFPVSGRFVVADSSLRPTGSVSLALVPEGVASRTVATDSSGAFTIPGVIAGIWKPLVSRIPPGLALIDVRQQGRSVYDDGFRLDGPGTYPLQVLLGPAANLEGTVLDSSQQSVVNARVLVRPAAPNESRTVLFREATTDSAGHFMIEGMAAGDYIVTLSGETEGVAVTLRVDRGNKVALTLSQK